MGGSGSPEKYLLGFFILLAEQNTKHKEML